MKSNLPDPISAATSPFAAFTFDVRFPFIINQLKANNPLSTLQEVEFDNLLQEIRAGVVPPGKGTIYPEDWVYWEGFFAEHAGKRYADVPFYAAEAYIYYRIIRIMDYKHTGLDPFYDLKSNGLTHHREFVEAMARKHMQQPAVFDRTYFTSLLYATLWANSADLSQLEINDALVNPALRKNLVIDDSTVLYGLLTSASTSEVDFIADNAGLELLSDLFLIDYLLNTEEVLQVHLHLKAYPTFVSDATIPDVLGHLEVLRSFQSAPLAHFVDRLEAYRQTHRLNLLSHPFWNSPCHFTKLPMAITAGFGNSSVLIVKGDANYRRLFEDREWPYTTPVGDVLNYLDRPCFSIRTLKSEIILGMDERKLNNLFNEDREWLTNGKYGLIMGNKKPSSI